MRKLVLVSALALAMPVAAHAQTTQLTFSDLGVDLNASNVDVQLTDIFNNALNNAKQKCVSRYKDSSANCRFAKDPSSCLTDAQTQEDQCETIASSVYSPANAVVHLDAIATGTATCTNPGGQTPPPFQHLTIPSVTVTGSVSGSTASGVPSALTTSAPVTPVPGAPDCPNSNWVENITDLSFTSATLTYSGPVDIPPIMCVFNPATQNGPVPPGSVSCTQQQ